MKHVIAFSAAAIALAACSNTEVGARFNSEAGTVLNAADFGSATMNNTLTQTGQRDYTINLAHRFAEEVNSTINFPFNSTALDEEARALLRQQADWIRQFPEVRFTVYGHTDLVGSTAYNRRLGLRRAEAVVLYLTSQGIDRSRLDAVVTHGETQPLVVTEGRERRNRRTVTEVSGFVESHPTVLQGQYAEVIQRGYIESAEAPVSLEGATVTDLSGD
jgi:outer membrane protein OmpA-like peptidoglycan-associated protein